jgi:formylglycine-generating enzyme required for sulfatase activity
MRSAVAVVVATSALVVVSIQASAGRAEAAAAAAAQSAACEPREYGGDGARITVECGTIDGRDTAVVRLSGDIESGDDRYFRQALLAADSDNVLVSLESEGGNLDAGIEIGRAIWFREAATVVEEGICASACALAWLAGRPRFMAAKARIGFHAPWHGDPDRPEASTAGSAVVGGYLRDLGLTSAAIEYINEPGPDEMRWLTPEDADALNIAVRPWQEQATPPVAVAPPPVEVAPVEPGSTFRDCDTCPEMIVMATGSFTMGSADSETGHQADEDPAHEVRLEVPFAVGRFEVTFDEWDACLADGGCDGHKPDDQHWGRGRRPVVDVSWEEAHDYTEWLSRKTGRTYRLLSEAEWEYAARAGTRTPYSFGATINSEQANFDGEKTVEVGSYPASPFGLSDMHGNVWEWVEDCYADSYRDAPSDGTAVSPVGCEWRVVRGGAWNTTTPENMRTAFRLRRVPGSARDNVGFRVARPLGETTEMSKGSP